MFSKLKNINALTLKNINAFGFTKEAIFVLEIFNFLKFSFSFTNFFTF